MKPLFIIIVILIAGYLVLPQSGSAEDDTLVVFVNRSANVDTLSSTEVRRLFLKEKTRYDDGSKAVPVHAKNGSALRKAFSKKVLDMNNIGEVRYWQKMMIQKGLTPPAEFSNTQKAVYSLKGGIGYCFKADYLPAINKIVMTI